MAPKPQWRSFDFSELERRLTEAKDMLAQAARMIEVSETQKLDTMAEIGLEQARRQDDHPHRQRYR